MKMGYRPPVNLITMEKWVKTAGNSKRKLYRSLVGSAPRASKVAPKQPHPPTMIASSSTTLAPTPRHQRLTTVGGWCDTIIQPFLSRFSSRRFSSRRFCDTKTPGWQNLVFWAQNQQRTHHKVGIARPPKAVHTAIYAKSACPYTHRAINNRRTECAGLPWWSFGSRRGRIVCGGSPHTFHDVLYRAIIVRSLHASSRTTTKAAIHTQCDGFQLLYGYMSTHPSRRSRYGWV
jgi:hypothetical protein